MKSCSSSVRMLVHRWAFLSFLTALTASGQPSTVIGWGWNSSGQTTAPGGLSDATVVSAGGNHSLALRSHGTVIGWGFNPRVPSGLNGIMALASGGGHDLALRSNRTVLTWGDNGAGQGQVPVGLSNVVAVAAGLDHSLALKADGTVVAWGYFSGTNVPPGLSNVIAIAAGDGFSLAVRSDGTVVSWSFFDLPAIPPGLSNVIAVAAGRTRFSVALKSDGTVTAWGGTAPVQRDVPVGLSSVVAIAAGSNHALALKSDGTVVAWGLNTFGPLNVPPTASNVINIAAGYDHSLALARPTPPAWPRITGQPKSSRSLVGDTVMLRVTATAAEPLSYRWQYRGQNLPDETNAALALTEVQLGQSGDYAVIVAAGGLSVRSAPAFLSVSNRPVALPQSIASLEDSEVEIELAAFDPSGLPLARKVVALPQRGRLFQSMGGVRGGPIESVPVVVAGDRLIYITAPDANGRDEFLFTAGNDLGDSLPAQVVIDIQSVNDPPHFVAGPDLTVAEDMGPSLFSQWAKEISAGPPDEVPQSSAFSVTHDNPALFRDPPRIDRDGRLTFTTAANAYGIANVTAVLQDDGGTAQGGQDHSAPQTFTLTVIPVNDPPAAIASASSPTALEGNDGTILVVIAPNNSNALVVLDASLSTDIEEDALEYLWFVEGTVAPLATGVRSTNLFETGSYTLALQAFDGAAIAASSVMLEVIAPGEAVDMLILQVNRADLERRNKRPLIASLKAAVASFDRRAFTSGINQLTAFQYKIRAQVTRTDPVLADTLIAATQRIIEALH